MEREGEAAEGRVAGLSSYNIFIFLCGTKGRVGVPSGSTYAIFLYLYRRLVYTYTLLGSIFLGQNMHTSSM